MNETISYLKAYGIDKEQADLLYKRLPSGKYIVAYIKYDIDVFYVLGCPKIKSTRTLIASCMRF